MASMYTGGCARSTALSRREMIIAVPPSHGTSQSKSLRGDEIILELK